MSEKTRLIIARHGNTFDKGDTVLRVGARTDLSLSNSGCQQALHMGHWLQAQQFALAHVFVSELLRTQQTATMALAEARQSQVKVTVESLFNELDYGTDDGQPEYIVQRRLGEELIAWEKKGAVPSGWQVNKEQLCAQWRSFARRLLQAYPQQNILVVTSNGIARFALQALVPDSFDWPTSKLATAAVGILEYSEPQGWQLSDWNIATQQ